MNDEEHLTEIEHDGRTITIIGTAHVSPRSVAEVERVIERIRPDTVCVELDKMRLEALLDDARWRKLDIFQVIKQGKVLYLIASLVLAAYQRRIGEKLGVKPGAEMLAAITMASKVGAELVLADRDVQATLKRTWARLSFFGKVKVLTALVASFFAAHEIDEEQIEALKDRDTITEMLKQFAEALPQVKQPLIDERDLYLIASVREAPGKRIVAVVGAGHVDGMVANLQTPVDRAALSEVPPESLGSRLVKWLVPAIVLAAFYYGYTEHAGETLRDMLYAWAIPTSVLGGLFTIFAGGKVLTVLAVAIASPLTSLNPTITSGMVAGLVEAWLRKPTVQDCEAIGDDMGGLRGWYRNPVLRVLLVTMLSTVGTALGAYIGIGWLVWLL